MPQQTSRGLERSELTELYRHKASNWGHRIFHVIPTVTRLDRVWLSDGSP